MANDINFEQVKDYFTFEPSGDTIKAFYNYPEDWDFVDGIVGEYCNMLDAEEACINYFKNLMGEE